ncbi:MAG TPA: sterol desaturase family protein [Vicinamibacterales bacterium]|nr:sterol desaturase family protein [Vicinamibacterales bacterium]
MSAREFLMNVTVIVTVMAIAALLETLVPMFVGRERTRGRRAANLGLTVVVFLLNWLLTSVAAIVALALSVRSAGRFGSFTVSLPLQIVSGVVLLDFSTGYLAHRIMHMWPTMWRFHRVHHSDDFVDVTTTYRTHPVETVWRFLFAIVPVWIIGIPPAAVLIQRLLQATNGVLEHANIRLWAPIDRVLSLLWVTPNVHKIHHSRQLAETNSNYGNILTIYDRLLRTYTPAERAHSVSYGLDDADPVRSASFAGLLSMPFTKAESGTGDVARARVEPSIHVASQQ